MGREKCKGDHDENGELDEKMVLETAVENEYDDMNCVTSTVLNLFWQLLHYLRVSKPRCF